MNQKTKNNQFRATDAVMLRSIDLIASYTDFIFSRRAMMLSPRTNEYYTFMLGSFITWAQSQ